MLRRTKWQLCVGLLLLLTLCSCHRSDPVPDPLIGTWQTSTPSHTGSTMEITKQRVVFASNRGVDVTGRIVRFKTIVERPQTLYQLSYQDQHKHEYQLYLLYDPTDGTVKLKNQPNLVWKRTGA